MRRCVMSRVPVSSRSVTGTLAPARRRTPFCLQIQWLTRTKGT
jgi:hypothetical protein